MTITKKKIKIFIKLGLIQRVRLFQHLRIDQLMLYVWIFAQKWNKVYLNSKKHHKYVLRTNVYSLFVQLKNNSVKYQHVLFSVPAWLAGVCISRLVSLNTFLFFKQPNILNLINIYFYRKPYFHRLFKHARCIVIMRPLM